MKNTFIFPYEGPLLFLFMRIAKIFISSAYEKCCNIHKRLSLHGTEYRSLFIFFIVFIGNTEIVK